MNHTYESLGSTFPDGRQHFFDYQFQGKVIEGSYEVIQPVIQAFKDGQNFEQRHPIVRQAVLNYFEGSIEDRWADDIALTIDLLQNWNSEGLLKNSLDLDKIGLLGHSVGGGTVGKVAMKDSRIKAAANLDGIQWGELIDSILPIPYLYVSADWPADHQDINGHVFINKSKSVFYECRLLNSGHANFMDIPFMIPVKSLTGCGSIDPALGIEIVTNLTVAFFDTHLNQLSDTNPKKISEQYELLDMKIFPGN